MTGPDAKLKSVRPIFKTKTDGKETLVAEQYLYAIKFAGKAQMVPGGDFFIGKDGKPYYPKDKTKPKPIPVAKYFFRLSKKELSNKAIEKLTRKDCFEPVTFSKDPKQTVVFQSAIPDHVFIMGKDGKSTNKFYLGAERYFRWEKGYPTAWITKPGKSSSISLEELLDKIWDLDQPYRDIYVVSHANFHGWLGFPLLKGTKEATSYRSLRKAKKDGVVLTDLSDKLGAKNKVLIRGCNIGQNLTLLNLLDEVMGGKSIVYAPTHKQTYRFWTSGKKKKAWEFFYRYWLRYEGRLTKKQAELVTDFGKKYPELPARKWPAYVKEAKRKYIFARTNWRTMFRHPPDLDPDKVLKFFKKHYAAALKKRKFRPTKFVKRTGPEAKTADSGDPYQAYTYHFEGEYSPRKHPPDLDPDKALKFFKKHYAAEFKKSKFKPTKFLKRTGPEAKTSDSGDTYQAYTYHFEDKAGGTLQLLVEVPTWERSLEVYPTDAEVLNKEKPRHAHPEWYDWSVSLKPVSKGKRTRIQAVAVFTLYFIKKPLIDAKGKYIQADLSNGKYYGQSTFKPKPKAKP